MQITTPEYKLKFLKYMCLFLSCIGLFWTSNDLYYDFAISLDSAVASGTVTQANYYQTQQKGGGLKDHYALNYEFQVDGKQYRKTNLFELEKDSAIEVTPDSFNSFPVGAKIQILFDSKDPNRNRPESFKKSLPLEWTLWIASSVALLLSLLWLFPKMLRVILSPFKDKVVDFTNTKER